MITLQIKNRYTHKVIFEYTCNDNTMKQTVEEAIRQKISLGGADLSYLDLSCMDLSYADLNTTDLKYTDLSYSNLECANLSYSNLESADLSEANLRNCDLDEVYLKDTKFWKGERYYGENTNKK